MDTNFEQNSGSSDSNELLLNDLTPHCFDALNVESIEFNESTILMQEEQNISGTEPENEHERLEKRQPNRRENVPMANETAENERQKLQQEHEQTLNGRGQPKKRGRTKTNTNAHSGNDSMVESELEQQSEQKRRRRLNPTSAEQIKTNSLANELESLTTAVNADDDDDDDATATATATDATSAVGAADASAVAAAAPAVVTIAERTIDRVQKMRKRENRHEYLVLWTTDNDAEWIDRDIMITKYAQHLIAYFEQITQFNQQSKTSAQQ